MKPLARIAAGMLAVATMTGCMATAPSKPVERNPEKSFALDVASAGRLHGYLRDAELPENAVRNVSGGLVDSAYIAQGFIDPMVGMTSSLNGLGNLLVVVTEDKFVNDKRHQLLAWMPKEQAADSEQAASLMLSMMKSSAVEALSTFGYSVMADKGFSGHNPWDKEVSETLYFTGEDCAVEGVECRIVIRVAEPGEGVAPSFVVSDKKPRYQWRNRKGAEMYVFKKDRRTTLHFPNMLKFYSQALAHLPDWAFYYVSPGMHRPDGVVDSKGRLPVFRYPFVLHQGKMHLFLKPQVASN